MSLLEALLLTQAVLAITGCGMIASVLRWQIGFFTLDSINVAPRTDRLFILGVVLVAQYFFVPCAEIFTN